jgi:hypothetical protein
MSLAKRVSIQILVNYDNISLPNYLDARYTKLSLQVEHQVARSHKIVKARSIYMNKV